MQHFAATKIIIKIERIDKIRENIDNMREAIRL
jgi:hypothetical protein